MSKLKTFSSEHEALLHLSLTIIIFAEKGSKKKQKLGPLFFCQNN
jgi:hypothetical protein